MTKQEFKQYLIDNQKEIVNAIASNFESGVNEETLEMADYAHEKMLDLLEERYDDDEVFEISQIDGLMYDAQKECGYFVKSGKSLADRMAAYHEARDERYNPLTKSFEKY